MAWFRTLSYNGLVNLPWSRIGDHVGKCTLKYGKSYHCGCDVNVLGDLEWAQSPFFFEMRARCRPPLLELRRQIGPSPGQNTWVPSSRESTLLWILLSFLAFGAFFSILLLFEEKLVDKVCNCRVPHVWCIDYWLLRVWDTHEICCKKYEIFFISHFLAPTISLLKKNILFLMCVRVKMSLSVEKNQV
jgi:hypothetical protein